jgi:putative heme-binding domain-containing protein
MHRLALAVSRTIALPPPEPRPKATMRAPLIVKRLIPTACLLLTIVGRPAMAAQQDHQYSTSDIEAGLKLYTAECSLCHGPNGDLMSGIDLRRGRFRRAVSDDDLARVITNGVPDAGMPAFKLQGAEVTALIAFIRAGFDVSGAAVKIGDPGRGKALFAGKAGCATCHRVNGVGPRTAPDLSDIGASRTAPALQRSLLDPSSAMWPINRPVRITTRDGKTFRGRRLNEDSYTVQIIDDQERLLTFVKGDLREFEVSTKSTMPAATALSSAELSDVIAYLLTLK